jgi:hypothetical protein
MSKVGDKYDYPDYSIDEAIEAIKMIEKNLLGREGSKQAIAKALNVSDKSSSFFIKLADLRKYGLIGGRGSNYLVTDLGRKLAYEEKKDIQSYQKTVQEVILSIPLYKELYNRLKLTHPTETQFDIALTDITGAHPEIIKEHSEKLRKIYIGLISKFSDMAYPTINPQPPIIEKPSQDSSQKNAEGWIKLYYGEETLNLKENAENIDLLIKALENRRDDLKEIQKSKK